MREQKNSFTLRKLKKSLAPVMLCGMMVSTTVLGGTTTFAQAGNSTNITDSEYQTKKWDATNELKEYLKKPIPFENSTQTPTGIVSLQEAQEYVIKAITEMQGEIVFYGKDGFDKEVIEGVIYNPIYGSLLKHPADEWKSTKTLVDYTNGIYKYSYNFQYRVSKEDAMRSDKRIDELATYLNSLAEKMPNVPGANNSLEYKKVRIIHDYIAKTVVPTNDESSMTGKLLKEGKDGKEYEVHGMASALFADTGVCQAYSMLFDRLGSRMGLETRFIRGVKLFLPFETKTEKEKAEAETIRHQGIAEKGGKWATANHGWNQVKIDGNWYHIDLTVDTALGQGSKEYFYNAFLLTDEEMATPKNYRMLIDKDKVKTFTDRTIWNKSEVVETAKERFKFGKLFDSSNKKIIPSLTGSRHPLGNFSSTIEKTFTDHKFSDIKPVYQILMPFDAKKTVKVPLSINSTEKLAEYLKIEGVKLNHGSNHYKFGSTEAVKVELTPEKSLDTVTENSIVDIKTTLEGREQNFKVQFVHEKNLDKPELKIKQFTKNLKIKQYHHSPEKYDTQKNEKNLADKQAELIKLAKENIRITNANGVILGVDVAGVDEIEKVNLAKPGIYDLRVYAKDSQGLRSFVDFKVEVEATVKESSVEISTRALENNTLVLNPDKVKMKKASSFQAYLGKSDVLDWRSVRHSAFGKIQGGITEKLYLIDNSGKEWFFNKDLDMFVDEKNPNNKLFGVKKMMDLTEFSGEYNLKLVAQHANELPAVKYVKLKIEKDNDVLATKEDINRHIADINANQNMTYSAKINALKAINIIKSQKILFDIANEAKEARPGEVVKYKIQHFNKRTKKLIREDVYFGTYGENILVKPDETIRSSFRYKKTSFDYNKKETETLRKNNLVFKVYYE